MILSDKVLRERALKDPEKMKQAKEWWEKGEWDKIADKILIYPFKLENLGLCCYDFSVGEEYISLRDPYKTIPLEKEGKIEIAPGETVLVLTEEYVCLPKTTMGIIVPRARWIFQGSAINASKVDPTWYGKLIIGFTNSAKFPMVLSRGKGFCTCYFMDLSEVEQALSKKEIPHLGRTRIGEIEFPNIRHRYLMSPDKVTKNDLENLVTSLGPPWDVVRGVIEQSKNEIVDFVEKEVAPSIISDATSAAVERAFGTLQKMMIILITGLLSAIFIALIR